MRERIRERWQDRAKTVRWLGVLLPLVLSYSVLRIGGPAAWLHPRVIAAVVVWMFVAAGLLIRRDWRGAAALTAMYAVADAWLTLLTFRAVRAGRATT